LININNNLDCVFHNKKDIEDIRQAARISKKILKELTKLAVEGSSAYEINLKAEELCKIHFVLPAFKGVQGYKEPFPGACCISVNDETLHTIPFSKRKFVSGDIVKVDFGIIYNGFFTDHCISIGIGDINEESKRLIQTTKLAVDTAIKKAVVGNKVGDISSALEQVSDLGGFEYIRGYSGHGIGKNLWEEPSIPYHGKAGTGIKLVDGMLICIEVQLSLGTGILNLDKDGWTLRTADKSKTAMFEHMLFVREGSPEILTMFE
jgi:methionyl aminopeptidase